MITNLKLEVVKLYVEMFSLLCLYVYLFFISAVVVILQTNNPQNEAHLCETAFSCRQNSKKSKEKLHKRK